MNCIKIIPPLQNFIDFYYYYSYFALVLNLLITPFQLYIILTQSTKLKSFKWFILNHSFWCLIWEIHFTIFKPIFLPPAIAGFPSGLFKDGSLRTSAVILYVGVILLVNCILALMGTILIRYLLVFPTSFTKCLNRKCGTFFGAILLIASYIIVSFIIVPYFVYDAKEFYQWAIQYDPCLHHYFEIRGFIFTPHFIGHNALIAALSVLLLFLIFLISLGIFFIYLIKTHKTLTLAKLQRSLITSAVVQLSVTLMFLIIPVTLFITVLCFEISNMENIFIIAFCFIATHSFIESLATLFFVAPYRKGIVKLYSNTVTFLHRHYRTLCKNKISRTTG